MIFQNVDVVAAFMAGLALFFTPCTLPLLPGWLVAVTGREYDEFLGENSQPDRHLKLHVFLSTVFFVLGFTLIFTLLGAAASAVGDFLYEYSYVLRILGGLVMILFALVLLGIIKPHVLFKDRRLQLSKDPVGYFGAFVIGLAFAAGWTPCSGPILASILSLAASSSESYRGIKLLAVFSFGLALPFLVISIFLAKVLGYVKHIGRHWVVISRVMGVIFLILAVLLIWGKLSLVTPDYQM
ncbi:MAG: cytochrome c biogenesis protein CcdA [Deltaproteobacteria bacterium]|jgi:cytochrome c-type biogenesis protein|nr:cytochrome c biogenesis protein CcdA [Deltaproteobacteria bacterium]